MVRKLRRTGVFLAREGLVTARTSPSLERHRAQRVGLGRHRVRTRPCALALSAVARRATVSDSKSLS